MLNSKAYKKLLDASFNLVPACDDCNGSHRNIDEVGEDGRKLYNWDEWRFREEAEKRGEDVELGYFSFAGGARATVFGQTEGIIKVVAGKKYGEVLGVHIIGPQATELIALASLAMRNELSVHEIKDAVYAHPSFAENFLEAIHDAINMMGKQ